MTPTECAAYEAKEKARAAAIVQPHPDVVVPTVTVPPEPPPPPPPTPEPTPAIETLPDEDVSIVEQPEAVLDVSDEELDADALLKSLEDD